MTVQLLGGPYDGELLLFPNMVLGDTIIRPLLAPREMGPGPDARPESTSGGIEYLRSKRTRPDGCVLYVLKGADL